MASFYFIRHGENPANITNEFSCDIIDYSLTSKGHLQAEQTAEYFQKNQSRIHAIYSSPLKRAAKTADIIGKTLDIPIVDMDYFQEIKMGVFEKRRGTPRNWKLFTYFLHLWELGDFDRHFPGGESFRETLHRVRKVFQEICSRGYHQNCIIVSHGGVIKYALSALCQEPASGQEQIPCRKLLYYRSNNPILAKPLEGRDKTLGGH